MKSKKAKKIIAVSVVTIVFVIMLFGMFYGFGLYHETILSKFDAQAFIYRGILMNNQDFTKGNDFEITYDFNCKEYKDLIEKYNLKGIAGEGTDFNKALNLMNHFARKMPHGSDYDGSIPENALDLLAYTLTGNGINCKAKSKIMSEMYLALGIYSRRIWMMPYSTEDDECHCVVEIFDKDYDKWILLDNSNNLYFVDNNQVPLSALEIREHLLEPGSYSIVFCDKYDWFEKLEIKFNGYKEYMNAYYNKNLAYIAVEGNNGFGVREEDKSYYLFPDNFALSAKEYQITKEAMYKRP